MCTMNMDASFRAVLSCPGSSLLHHFSLYQSIKRSNEPYKLHCVKGLFCYLSHLYTPSFNSRNQELLFTLNQIQNIISGIQAVLADSTFFKLLHTCHHRLFRQDICRIIKIFEDHWPVFPQFRTTTFRDTPFTPDAKLSVMP